MKYDAVPIISDNNLLRKLEWGTEIFLSRKDMKHLKKLESTPISVKRATEILYSQI